MLWNFLGNPVFKTPNFHTMCHGLNLWSGIYDPTFHRLWPKKKKKGITLYLTPDVILDLMKISIFHKQNPAY